MKRIIRVACLVLADLLADPIREKIAQKYRLEVSHVARIDQYINEVLGTVLHVPAQATALVTEWVASLSIPFFNNQKIIIEAVNFYFSHYKEDKYKNICLTLFPGKNSKNLLNFDLSNLQNIQEHYNNPSLNRLGFLPEGASIFYKDNSWIIVSTDNPDAAALLGKGTSWCTKDDKVAYNYIEDGTLYVIYKDGKKYAQFHFGDIQEAQLNDVGNGELDPNDPVREALRRSGLLYNMAINIIHKGRIWEWNRWFKSYPEDKKAVEKKISENPNYSYDYASNILGHRFYAGEPEIAKYSYLAYDYADYVVHGRFELGEPAIARDDTLSYKYAVNVLKDRFKLGEKSIIRDRIYLKKYVEFLQSIGNLELFLPGRSSGNA